MKCPCCKEINNKVVNSRLSRDGIAIRRRRECIACGRRFTTYEHVEQNPLMVIKKDGCREVFLREKLSSGIKKACQKRNISMNLIDTFLNELEKDLREIDEKENYSYLIGERVMTWLKDLDGVAYVRFASVYREFKDVNDFVNELKTL
ncbi:MAG TPA: transcriptional regulator NrdR [Desulfobacteraceae bacterium]|nr:transcriptional regulator NrdR [Desulfobacteraceae bacterium]